MSLKSLLNEDSVKKIQQQGEQFNRYWKSVSDDLKNLTECMVKNFEVTHERINEIEKRLNERVKK